MNIHEMVVRFPEIPPSLHHHPSLARYGEVFGEFLERAWKPSNCQAHQQTAENRIYTHLVSPLGMVNYGLVSPEKAISKLENLIADYERDPKGFVERMVPSDVAQAPGGCMGKG